jgi:hypothetical protein
MRDSSHDLAPRSRPGLSAGELVVILVLASGIILFLLMAVPRGREQARLNGCQRNLAQIGQALSLYDQVVGSLPTVSRLRPLDAVAEAPAPGPLRSLLEALGLQDFRSLSPGSPPPAASGPVPGEIPVAGFICSSDPNATSGLQRAPVSYRALTGSDELGMDGPFAPGRRMTVAQVEAADGTSFTAGFSERLVGDGRDNHLSAANYAVVRGELQRGGCTLVFLKDQQAGWRGDAGASWRPADYVSTLYNHGLPPGARLSCLAADGTTAFQGASSGHVRGVNLLMLDGAVKLVLPSVDPKIWKAYADVAPAGSGPPGP